MLLGDPPSPPVHFPQGRGKGLGMDPRLLVVFGQIVQVLELDRALPVGGGIAAVQI